MRRKTYRIIAIMATALLALATGGCVDPLDDSLKPQPEEPTLTFWIKVPGSMQAATKAQTGNVASDNPESTLYDIQVWVFAHAPKTEIQDDIEVEIPYEDDPEADNDLPLNYIDEDDLSFKYISETPRNWEKSHKIQVPLPKEFVLGPDPEADDYEPLVDIYILANWQSIFETKPDKMKRSEVRDLVFGTSTMDTYFGTTSPTMAVPENKGLPISKIYKGENGTGVSLGFLRKAYLGKADAEPLTNDLFKNNLGVIELERAVAKVRFVFARTTGLYGEVTKIEINGGMIPDNIYAFKHETVTQTGTGDEAVTVTEIQLPGTSYGSTTTLPGIASASIMEVADPLVLRSDYVPANVAPTSSDYKNYPAGMDAQAYDTYLTNAIGEATATTELVYFRESDKMITGKIYFKKSATGQEEFKEFVMTPLEKNDNDCTNLHRNHYWTVYAYFLDGDLYVKPKVADWTNAPELTYELKMSTNMRLFDSWLYRYDTDGDYDNWNGSHMAVSDGKITTTSATETVIGRPLRSPQIQLVTTGVTGSSFQLTIDNSDCFQLVKVVKIKVKENTGDPDVVVTDGTGVVKEYVYGDVIDISGGENVYTYFYIVPKEGVDWIDDDPSTWENDDPSDDIRTNRKAKVFLFYEDPVLGRQKVTFNYSSLPGYSDDSSEIWAYYFPAPRVDHPEDNTDPNYYNKEGKLRMYYQDYNHPLVPVQ